MRRFHIGALLVMLAASAAFAGPQVDTEGPLAPCAGSAPTPSATAQPALPWGVDVATSFSEQETLDDFAQMQQDYADILANVQPTVVAQCNLSMGTKLQYSARIGTETREEADKLCDKLKANGGACIVQKN